jgi:hypothetical protein
MTYPVTLTEVWKGRLASRKEKMTEEQVVAWTAVPEKAPVVDQGGTEIGKVDSVLGDEDDDIFHGLAVNMKGMAGIVEVSADRVDRITTERVYTTVPPEEVDDLPPFKEDRWFDFEGVSRFLKKPKWDKEND